MGVTAWPAIADFVGAEYVTILVVGVTLFLFSVSRLPVGLIAMISAVALCVTGCIVPAEVYVGWTNSMTIMVMCMLIIGEAMLQSGAVTMVGQVIMKFKFVENERAVMMFFVIAGGILSAFLSNTAVMACFIPVVRTLCAASRGRVKIKNIMMPMAVAVSVGGGLTLVGSTSQVMVNTVLVERGSRAVLGMFDFTPVVLPNLIVVILYFATIGYKIMWAIFDFEDVVQEVDPVVAEKFRPSWRTWISIAVLAFCVYGFVAGLWNMVVVACVGAVVCLGVGCCDFKESLQRLDWNTVFVMAFSQAIAVAMSRSGAGKIIAEFAVKLVGNNLLLQLTVCAIVTVFLTNIMSNTAVAAMMTPIYLVICCKLGVKPDAFMMVIAVSSNLAIATPIGTSSMTMSLQGGYRFKDYLKIGLPLAIIGTIVTIAMSAVIYGVAF